MVTQLTDPAVQPSAYAALGPIALLAKPGGSQTGVGRYVASLQAELELAGVSAARVTPPLPPLPVPLYGLLLRAGLDARAFFSNFPVWPDHRPANVYHLTSQNLASLLAFSRPRGRVVVTVHDILPYMLRDDPRLSTYRTAADRLLDRLAMLGLRRADLLISDSAFTRDCLIAHLGVPPERIAVVHLGIDQARFRPVARDPALLARYSLPAERRYLIYVGSEDPRKNLEALLRALAIARSAHPDLALIKVGRAHFTRERERLTRLAVELGVRDAIHLLDDVPEDDLVGLYSLAEVAVQPSRFEGFGFPLLEAMACGTPAIFARAASLPELAGEAGLGFDPALPDAAATLAGLITRVISDPELAARLRGEGLRRASAFTWARTARETAACYAQHKNLASHSASN